MLHMLTESSLDFVLPCLSLSTFSVKLLLIRNKNFMLIERQQIQRPIFKYTLKSEHSI